MTATPADHSFHFDPSNDPCPYCDKQMAGALNCQSCIREHPDRPWPQEAIDQEMIERALQDEIEILEMCLPVYCDAGGIWFRNNHNMADGRFKDWGAARAFARAATALPSLVKALEDLVQQPHWAAGG